MADPLVASDKPMPQQPQTEPATDKDDAASQSAITATLPPSVSGRAASTTPPAQHQHLHTLEFVADLPNTAHPQLARIRRELDDLCAPDGAVTVVPVLDRRGRNQLVVGEGHIYRAHFPVPPDSAYDFLNGLQVELTWPSPLDDDAQPAVRICQVFEHSQVREDGFLPPALLAFNLDRLRARDTASPMTLGEALAAVLAMLLRNPLPEPPTALDEMDEEDLLALWAEHDPDCHCLINQLMPCSFQDFLNQTESEARADRLITFHENVATRHAHLFTRARDHFALRMGTARQWLAQTQHPALFDAVRGWPETWFLPSFWTAMHAPNPEAAIRSLAREITPGVWSFGMFTPEFCDLMAADLAAYEKSGLPKTRPNSMNRYGMILADMGMASMLDRLLWEMLNPIQRALLPALAQGLALDHHHSFVVQYEEGLDVHLDMHTDDAEFTCNVNLTDDFSGSGLTFCGMHGATSHRKLAGVYQHQRGHAVVHAGLHRHGADPLQTGRRENLIIWCRSSAYRQTREYKARYANPFLSEEAPDQRCLSTTHDRDYSHWTDVFAQAKQDPDQLPLHQTHPTMNARTANF
ncbi:uncharacterized protein MONBRDRAFT_38748 [Monosiga brevicollis MX1]|uniref:Fe2OG dioxygenase domain-containing protein n=1 Tax=Monosiga brevicollis TaxID=81824 RepID=A9V9W4_MONBE|nr:uncharacterized protein MONBRDRAFT_38748 [Monosiga brevicollis MX1]EDQ85559.1 predicted protein [Monosiga brevicollis MX1]|eukprot:XP_001749508.1 hypothetical protein [Monosiga brevicollis MX1]